MSRRTRQTRLLRKKRRGIILLITVSLLTLFVLIAVTYALVASVYRDSATTQANRGLIDDPPETLLDTAFYTLVRGPRVDDENNPLRFNDLLSDKYGASWRTTTKATSPQQHIRMVANSGNQLLEFDFDPAPLGDAAKVDGFFGGCVVTFLSGQLKNTSCRVAHYTYDATLAQGRVTAVVPLSDIPQNFNGSPVSGTSGYQPEIVLFNGREFGGVGGGYIPPDGITNLIGKMSQEALHPNRVGEKYDNSKLTSPPSPLNDSKTNYLKGLVNESYDAPDFQNSFLAAVIPDPTDPNKIKWVKPSFHDRHLIKYSKAKESTLAENRYTFRPTANATAGLKANASFPALVDNDTPGFGDVDNDNDGVLDSVFMDVGLPVRLGKNGRLQKPLVAYLCLDLDGRFNLNYHGKLYDIDQSYRAAVNEHYQLAGDNSLQTSDNKLYKGYGLGPPEVKLSGLFTNADLDYLYRGRTVNGIFIPGRYGYDKFPGIANQRDPLAFIRLFEIPNFYDPANSLPRSSYMSQSDPLGRFTMGINAYGQPTNNYSTELTENRDLDYEMNSHWNSPRGSSISSDSLFGPGELERILRPNDLDIATLQTRLTNLVDAFASTNANVAAVRRLVTTDSYGSSAPLAFPTVDQQSWNNGLDLPTTLGVILAKRIARDGGPAIDTAASSALLRRLLPPEVLRGERMDLNRPFGDGIDNSTTTNGVVDEGQDETGTTSSENNVLYTNPTNASKFVALDPSNGNAVAGESSGFLARQYMARYLYVLAMLLKDRNAEINEDGIAGNNTEETARAIAQWAINVVDFRDADSINTPFLFDVTPLDGASGWAAKDKPTFSDLADTVNWGLVWGAERPELLLSEAVAIHDRASEDLANGTDGKKKTTDVGINKDDDFDQRLKPRSAAFIELYNPWAGTSKTPRELYDNTPGVNLAKTTAGGTPVWRVLVCNPTTVRSLDPDNPNAPLQPNDILRSVYFTDPSSLTTAYPIGHGKTVYYGTTSPVIQPGRYAVVGTYESLPAGLLPPGTTTVGRVAGWDATMEGKIDAYKRRFVMDTAANSFQLLQNNYGTAGAPNYNAVIEPFPTNDAQQVTVVPITQPRAFSVTDFDYAPLALAAGSTWDQAAAGGEGAYDPPIGQPFDTNANKFDLPTFDLPAIYGSDDLTKPKDLTTPNFRRVVLQRLANPLASYHPASNPYLTIDGIWLPLTSFNGIAKDSTGTAADIAFRSYERGWDDKSVKRNLWRTPFDPGPLAGTLVKRPQVTDMDHIFGYQLWHTLGHLNTDFRKRLNGMAGGTNHVDFIYDAAFTNGDTLLPKDGSGTVMNSYIGAPKPSSNVGTNEIPAFPWLAFHNRPFNSAHEIMMVPRFSQSTLLANVDFTSASTPSPYQSKDMAYGYLFSFFNQSHNPATNDTFNLYRLFEFVNVPSRFCQADFYLNQSVFAGAAVDPNLRLKPPFARVNNFRDPGMVNINTCYAKTIWDALQNNRPRPTWDDFVHSRRGYTPEPKTNMEWKDGEPPTLFANPIRGLGSGRLVPEYHKTSSSPSTPNGKLERPDIECSLLRSMAVDPSTGSINVQPLFASDTMEPYRDYRRNPHFYYENLHRVPNMVTHRSNVFAIWITIAYFEIDPTASTPTVGQEMGTETGEIQRHRAFYIIDRSIPVAFEPGENHNVDRAVLLRRMIE